MAAERLRAWMKRFFPQVIDGGQIDSVLVNHHSLDKDAGSPVARTLAQLVRLYFAERRFLLMTRRGPVELVFKPLNHGIIGTFCMIGFVSVVYWSVLALSSAVEVANRDLIKHAEAQLNPPLQPSVPHRHDENLHATEEGGGAEVLFAAPAEGSKKPVIGERPDLSPAGLAAADAMAMLEVVPLADMVSPRQQPALQQVLPERLNQADLDLAAPGIASNDSAMLKKSPESRSWLAMFSALSSAGDVAETAAETAVVAVPEPEELEPAEPAATALRAQLRHQPKPAKMPAAVPFPPVPDAQVEAVRFLVSVEDEIRQMQRALAKLGIDTELIIGSHEALPEGITTADPQSPIYIEGLRDRFMILDKYRNALRFIPFQPPMRYFYISSPYGNRRHPVTKKSAMHYGIDMAGTWQEEVQATADGVVTDAGWEGSYGRVVRIEHKHGIKTIYAHLAKSFVEPGQVVSEGDVIGSMGSSGRVKGAHLHYEIRVNGKPQDPYIYFETGRKLISRSGFRPVAENNR